MAPIQLREEKMSGIHWFEISVGDMDRAKSFYEKVLDVEIPVMDLTEQMGSIVASLPDRGGVGGALVESEKHNYVPSMAGTLVYLVVDGDLSDVLQRAQDAGGEVLLPKTPLGDAAGGGFTGWIKDSEGNRVGLYSKE
jgi:predicted enzyme related to lactoylglutathione lyase